MYENFTMKPIIIWNWDMLIPHTNSECALTLTLDGNLYFVFGGNRVRTGARQLTSVLDQHGRIFLLIRHELSWRKSSIRATWHFPQFAWEASALPGGRTMTNHTQVRGFTFFLTTEAQKAFLALIFCFKQAGVSNLQTVGYKQLMTAMNGAQYKNVNLLKTLCWYCFVTSLMSEVRIMPTR